LGVLVVIFLIVTGPTTKEGGKRCFKLPLGVDFSIGVKEKALAIRFTLEPTEQGWLIMQ
jgi:hypothetical protein